MNDLFGITYLFRNEHCIVSITYFLFAATCKRPNMIEGVSPILQAAIGTMFTWGLTAAGSALVFIFSGAQVSHIHLL